MGFSVVCHGCGEVLYEDRDRIPLYRLRAKCDGRCPEHKRKLSVILLSIILEPIEDFTLENMRIQKSILKSKQDIK
jgi:hypothetical protein